MSNKLQRRGFITRVSAALTVSVIAPIAGFSNSLKNN